jgi:hypothetical protein
MKLIVIREGNQSPRTQLYYLFYIDNRLAGQPVEAEVIQPSYPSKLERLFYLVEED